ncbi:MAG: hypothetical protein R3D84_14020 [Paracoccaceae bacterium]
MGPAGAQPRGALADVLARAGAGLGGLALAVALTGWAATPRPELLIAGDGKLAGLLGGPDGLRGLSKAKGAGFVAQSWLENDGDMVEQAEAAERAGFSGTTARRAFRVAGRPAVLLAGKTAEASFAEACAAAALVVIDAPRPAQSGPCLVIDAALLEKTGPLAIRAGENGLDLTATRAPKARLWSGTHRDSADWQHARWAWPEAAVRRAGTQAPR